MKDNYVFNRVLGLKFLYDNFPHYFNPKRINMIFVNSKQELLNLKLENEDYDTFVLKRSGNNKNGFISDIKCKDNRFFDNLLQLKNGLNEFNDEFDFCVECHKFKKGENYYSDRLAIAQFSTENLNAICDKISFIPSYNPKVNTRDNEPYAMLEFPYDYENIYTILKLNKDTLQKNNLNYYCIDYLAKKIHKMIDNIREFLNEINCRNTFQLIIRIDSYLNLLPIDFRTPEAWAKKKK